MMPLSRGLQCNDVLPISEHDPTECDFVDLFDDVADHHEGVYSGVAVRRKVVRAATL